LKNPFFSIASSSSSSFFSLSCITHRTVWCLGIINKISKKKKERRKNDDNDDETFEYSNKKITNRIKLIRSYLYLDMTQK
jgi:hypothetical protein